MPHSATNTHRSQPQLSAVPASSCMPKNTMTTQAASAITAVAANRMRCGILSPNFEKMASEPTAVRIHMTACRSEMVVSSKCPAAAYM